MIDLDTLKQMLESTLRVEETRLEQFKRRLAEDPLNAFKWSEDDFQAAARIDVAKRVLIAMRKPEVSTESLREFSYRVVLHGSERQESSTSPAMNLASRHELSAWAGILKVLEGRL